MYALVAPSCGAETPCGSDATRGLWPLVYRGDPSWERGSHESSIATRARALAGSLVLSDAPTSRVARVVTHNPKGPFSTSCPAYLLGDQSLPWRRAGGCAPRPRTKAGRENNTARLANLCRGRLREKASHARWWLPQDSESKGQPVREQD